MRCPHGTRRHWVFARRLFWPVKTSLLPSPTLPRFALFRLTPPIPFLSFSPHALLIDILSPAPIVVVFPSLSRSSRGRITNNKRTQPRFCEEERASSTRCTPRQAGHQHTQAFPHRPRSHCHSTAFPSLAVDIHILALQPIDSWALTNTSFPNTQRRTSSPASSGNASHPQPWPPSPASHLLLSTRLVCRR